MTHNIIIKVVTKRSRIEVNKWLRVYRMSHEYLKTLYNITLLSVDRIFMLLFDTCESSITINPGNTTLGIVSAV